MTSYKEAYKYPFIVSEILSSKNRLLVRAFLNVENAASNYILDLIKVLDNKEILNTTIPGYINKIISSHIENELLYKNISANNNVIFDILFRYIYNDSYRDLFYMIINESVKRGKEEYYDVIPKLFDSLLNYMNNYILIMNKEEDSENIIEIKDSIYNLIYILIKLAENSDILFQLIVKKLSEGELLTNLKKNLKETDEEENEEEIKMKNKNNLVVFYCLNKLFFLFLYLFNVIVAKNENDKYAFNKYFLSTIIDPPYNPYNYVPSYVTNNKEKEEKNPLEESINLLINSSISYLKEIYSIFENKIEIINDLKKSTIFSFYNKITDILILISIIGKKDNEKLDIFLNEILIDLIQLIIDYPFSSLIHNKTLKIFQYIIEFNFSIKKDQIIKYLYNYFNDKKINELITDEGVILNNKKESNNNIYLINILNYDF